MLLQNCFAHWSFSGVTLLQEDSGGVTLLQNCFSHWSFSGVTLLQEDSGGVTLLQNCFSHWSFSGVTLLQNCFSHWSFSGVTLLQARRVSLLSFYCSFISRVSHTEDVQSNITPAVIIWSNIPPEKIALRGTSPYEGSLHKGSEADQQWMRGLSPVFFYITINL